MIFAVFIRGTVTSSLYLRPTSSKFSKSEWVLWCLITGTVTSYICGQHRSNLVILNKFCGILSWGQARVINIWGQHGRNLEYLIEFCGVLSWGQARVINVWGQHHQSPKFSNSEWVLWCLIMGTVTSNYNIWGQHRSNLVILDEFCGALSWGQSRVFNILGQHFPN